ncbi:ATP-binding protein [Streptomyces parvulus]|uniref:ATP-binding protein n=1 Tax=Streptomyces parvulus TaxID=146923 RepID=A0A369UWF2_9ACTN|nr:ATP-binding protein [Streptomyces parvulus]RDD85112.1 ATP-binding protein [Streptomyces parvulus]
MYVAFEKTPPSSLCAVSGEPGRSWIVPHAHRAVATARQEVRCALVEAGGVGEGAADDALLVVSELTTNSITHALPPVTLRVAVLDQECIRIEVVDSGAPPPGCRQAGQPTDEHGRGNAIVSTVASRTGELAQAGRVTRWAEVPLD